MKKEENWEVISFQRSASKNSKIEIYFTINLGICSVLIRSFLEHSNDHRPNDIEDCHWRKRIGFYMPSKQDFWWRINDSTSLEALSKELIDLLTHKVMPEMNLMVSNNSLEEMWMSGRVEGLTEVERYIFLTTLLKLKESKYLQQVALAFKTYAKGKPYAITATEHLKLLGQNE